MSARGLGGGHSLAGHAEQVELGRACWADDRAATAGQVLRYLPGRRVVVVLVDGGSDGGDWWCRVVARLDRRLGEDSVLIPRAEVLAGHTVMHVDAVADPDTYLLAWLARMWRDRPGGRSWLLTRSVIGLARIPDSVRVRLDVEGWRYVKRAAHLSEDTLQGIVSRLLDAGLMVTCGGQALPGRGLYRLTIPTLAPGGADVGLNGSDGRASERSRR